MHGRRREGPGADAAAAAAAKALEFELDYAVKEIDGLDKVSEETQLLRRRAGAEPMAAFALAEYSNYAEKTRTEISRRLERAKQPAARVQPTAAVAAPVPAASAAVAGPALVEMDVTLFVRDADLVDVRSGPSTTTQLAQVNRRDALAVTGRTSTELPWYRVPLRRRAARQRRHERGIV